MNFPPPTQLRAPTTAEQEALQNVFRKLRDSRDSVANARNDILGIAWGGKGKTHSSTEQVVDVSTAFSVYASTAEIQLSNLLRVVSINLHFDMLYGAELLSLNLTLCSPYFRCTLQMMCSFVPNLLKDCRTK